MVTHPCINWAHDCLTSVIKCKMFTPCYVSPHRFPISEQGYTVGKLLDGTECQILLDAEANKPFMSKSHYLHCKSLHSLPKFASKTENSSRKWTIH